MAKIVKKTKPFGGLRTYSPGGSSVETSTLRPVYVPKTAPCSNGCPNETNIREFLTTISQSEDCGRSNKESFEKAWEILTEKNPFPSTCGRVCPHPCEVQCNRNYKEGAVSINNLERFVGDFALENNLNLKMSLQFLPDFSKFPERGQEHPSENSLFSPLANAMISGRRAPRSEGRGYWGALGAIYAHA